MRGGGNMKWSLCVKTTPDCVLFRSWAAPSVCTTWLGPVWLSQRPGSAPSQSGNLTWTS